MPSELLRTNIHSSKPPTQTVKSQTIQRMILAYFRNVIHLLSQSLDKELLRLAITESAKIIPYVVSDRKAIKLYLKVGGLLCSHCFWWNFTPLQKCLDLWSSADDDIRIAAFLSVRQLALSNDNSILDNILRVSS